MRRTVPPLVVFGCLAALVLVCYGPALFQGRQFAYRDAAHYYYPLYERVETEWRAGRWPLWEPEENGGMPLLGNPTAAVLYPGKIIYRVLPYAWGARLYVLAHTLLAFSGMVLLLRSWGASGTGAALGGLGYAFGAPVLFQYCNIIYLVGAAWLPFGVRAVDRWLRLGRRGALLELAVVLALETLGGDPETAYLTGLCAGGYALGLSWWRGRVDAARRVRLWPWVLVGVLAFVVWTAGTLAMAHWAPLWRPGGSKPPPRALPWMSYVPLGVSLVWLLAGAVVLGRWRRSGGPAPLGVLLAGLAGSALLAGGLAAAQLLPVLEFTRQSGRAAGEGTHDIYPFSLEPVRVVEFLWPNPFGTHFAGNRNWLPALARPGDSAKVWVPSLYLGGLTLILGLGALGFRHGPPWRVWLSAIAVLSLLAALGEYTGPLWWARFHPEMRALVGPHDSPEDTAIRLDRYLRDGDGSVYWALATALPGFKQFRFPSKLLTFTAFALSALAGLEWDRVASERSRRTAVLAACALVGTACALVVGLIFQAPLVEVLQSRAESLRGAFGPLDVPGAVGESQRSLFQATVVLAVVLFLTRHARRRPERAGALALILLSADLAVANARFVLTVPQALMEEKPEVVRLIEEAERAQPSAGPFRVHRVPLWQPIGWSQEGSVHRVRDFLSWERATIQPKYGLKYGIEYTKTLGVAELYDYEWFFGPWTRPVSAEVAGLLGVAPGERVVVYPRHGFDLWNTRYFVLPFYPGNWKDEQRGIASFLLDTERVYPPPDAFRGVEGADREKAWVERHDFQVRRNQNAFPRAWIVHAGRYLAPPSGLTREERDQPMQEILYSADPLWSDPLRDRVPYDASTLAWLDRDRRPELAPFLPGMQPSPLETVKITSRGPQRVELDADLRWPGMVVLADIYYPGWALTIDGTPAPVYRANRMMRGAAVPAGKHRLVYTYQPRSFRVGLWVSLVSLTLCAGLTVWFRRPPATTLEDNTEPIRR